MGISRIFRYNNTSDSTPEEKRISQVLEIMQANPTADWTVQVTVLLPKSSSNKAQGVFLVNFEENIVALLTSQFGNEIVQADSSFHRLIENSQICRLRQSIKISGKIHQLGDFLVKLGTITVGGENKGLVMEIEFSAAMTLGDGKPGILEFVSYLDPFGNFQHIDIEYCDRFKLNSEFFTLKHTAIDILAALNCIEIK